MRPEARLHLLLPSRRAQPFADDADTRGSCWSRRARTTRSRDTHWYRPDFDRALAQRGAGRRAPIYLDGRGSTALRHEGDGTALEGERDGRAVRITARFVDRRERAARVPAPRARPRRGAAPLAAADAGLYTHFEASSAGTGCGRRRARRPIRSTMPRCIRCSRAAGSGCCGSTTASPAPAPR